MAKRAEEMQRRAAATAEALAEEAAAKAARVMDKQPSLGGEAKQAAGREAGLTEQEVEGGEDADLQPVEGSEAERAAVGKAGPGEQEEELKLARLKEEGMRVLMRRGEVKRAQELLLRAALNAEAAEELAKMRIGASQPSQDQLAAYAEAEQASYEAWLREEQEEEEEEVDWEAD